MKKDPRKKESTIRKDIINALENYFPNDMIDFELGFDFSYFEDIYEKLKDQLSRLPTANLDYERNWMGDDFPGNPDEPSWDWRFEMMDPEGMDDLDELYDPEEGMEELASSYHLFFLGLKNRRYHLHFEDEPLEREEEAIEDQYPVDEPVDEVIPQRSKGIEIAGCLVAISLIAPFAVIIPDGLKIYEDGSYNLPDIFPHIFEIDGGPVDMAAFFRETRGEAVNQDLNQLSAHITAILQSFGIEILPPIEAEKPVPWLHVSSEAMLIDNLDNKPLTLKDALFFRGIY